MWGVGNSFKDTEPFEHLQLKFVKEILGVHCKASNAACLAELNRKPLKTKIQLAAIKLLVHIINSQDSLVYKVFRNVVENSIWVKTVKEWLSKLGFVHLNQNLTNISYYLKCIQQRINDQALQNQNNLITGSTKLEFFSSVHKIGVRPHYVVFLEFKSDRSTLCKFSFSAHSLEIERGRYF